MKINKHVVFFSVLQKKTMKVNDLFWKINNRATTTQYMDGGLGLGVFEFLEASDRKIWKYFPFAYFSKKN